MNIVISGYYGFDNVGDEAILFSIIQAFREIDPNINITVLSNNPDHTANEYGVKAVNRWNLRQIFSAIKEADGLVSGGGSLLQDETGPKSVPYYTGVMKIAQLLGKPVFIYAQGMGPLNKTISRKIVKAVLQKTRITVRDEESKALLQSIGLSNDIQIVPDPVLGMKVSLKESEWWKKQSFSEKVVSVSVRDWPAASDYKQQIAMALDHLVKEGVDVVFIPMHGHHDDETSREVGRLMKEKYYIFPYNASIEEKVKAIAHSDVLLGMRLHALIFAAISNTPFAALSYDPKIDSFAKISNQPVIGHVNDKTLRADAIYSNVEKILRNLDVEKEKLFKAIQPLQDSALQTAMEAYHYFKQ
jgi:polysaccharide pyruvyl transferase CsaB